MTDLTRQPPSTPARAVAATIILAGFVGTSAAQAATVAPPVVDPMDNNAQLSAGATVLDIGSNFLQRLGRQATWGYAVRDNSGGGGAPASSAPLLYRSWSEVYGVASRTSAQGDFAGDSRKTGGVVAGVGMTLAPGFSAGVSIDQSHTRIDIPLALQSATLDLTQIGVNGAYTTGPWTLAFAAVHGMAWIDSRRNTGFGTALAGYRGGIDGALGELSYYYELGQGRIVPKLGVEYVVATTNGFQESGGFAPVQAAGAHGERARVMVGAEIGRYWIVDRHIVDVSAYGKFVDNFAQTMSTVQVSVGNSTIAVQGIRESMYGADTGAAISYLMSAQTRLYASYDGKFRDGFNSQQGTLGIEMKW